MERKATGKLVVKAGTLATKAYKMIKSRSFYSFQNRVVLITGGSRGLGLVMARELVQMGAKVALMARDAAELARAADDLRARGGVVLTITGDVGQREAAEGAVEQTVATFGRLDVLINNAGIIQIGPFEHMALEDFEQTMAVHFWGPLYTTRAALPHLIKRDGARIVNVSSFGGKMATPHLLPYCASKFALVGLSNGLRIALARYSIPVTTVSPGLLRTGVHLHELFKGQQEEEYRYFATALSTPLLSMGAIRAANRILGACARGDAELVLGRPYGLAARLVPLLPGLTASGMALLNRLLPGPTGPQGDVALEGWACRSRTPWIFTYLSDRAALANNQLPCPTAVPMPATPARSHAPGRPKTRTRKAARA